MSPCKLHQNQWNACEDMAINHFENGVRPPCWILKFNFVKISPDIAISVIFKTAAVTIMDCQKIGNFNSRSAVGGQCA